ncbi:hypothetical protein ACR78Z_12810 [Sphingobacterium thalpophilum]|uniref:hypothetical protein n=1 Tax=Sphingobacterium thalpophilum TaxID=259 RepID=UPI003DA2D19F
MGYNEENEVREQKEQEDAVPGMKAQALQSETPVEIEREIAYDGNANSGNCIVLHIERNAVGRIGKQAVDEV